MKKIIFVCAMLLLMAACTTKSTETATVENNAAKDVSFEVAKNYFFKNGQEIPSNPKITEAEAFGKLFGMATTMGADGKPAEIDFAKEFVLATVLPVTDIATEITPVKVEAKGDTLLYTYDVKTGEKQSYSIQPIAIIILDKKYADYEVILKNQ